MTNPAAPSPRLILQTAQALSICADPPEPWAGLTPQRQTYWKDAARLEHGLSPIPAPHSRVVVTSAESSWHGTAGEVAAIIRDATGAPWLMVALEGRGGQVLFAVEEVKSS